MPESVRHKELPPAIRRVLDAVRRRIRAYVWLEGTALVIVLVGAAFWLGLATDWIFEPSPSVRRVGLIVLALAVVYVAYRYLLRRIVVTIPDSSAAALLERRFPNLSEHLLTSVDVSRTTAGGTAYHPDLVHRTQQSAVRAVANIDASAVFNRGPLVRAIGAAAVLCLSIGLFALVSREAFGFWLERIALSDEPWPRRVHLEVVGFPADDSGRRVHKLAQEDDFELLVHAHTDGYEVPDEVEIRFQLADGRRGRDTMIRVGDSQPAAAGVSDPGHRPQEFQLFRYKFKRVAGDMEFDVVGGDDRVRDLRLQIVERPKLFAIELEFIYPEYLGQAPRRLPVTGGMRIPEGTQLVLHAGATKPLTTARIHKSSSQQDDQIDFRRQPQDELRWDYGTLADDDVLQVSVTDTDGVATREPYRISLAVVRDEVPQVTARLSGIGGAITPDALLPIVGRMTDDYGLENAWFEFQVDGGPVATRPLSAAGLSDAGYSEDANSRTGESAFNKLGEFDTREVDPATGRRAIELRPGQRFALSIKATDRYDLNDEPREGSSQQFVLDVVTPNDLLALLERSELALRQRYEAIYEKMTDTRNLLSRVEFGDSENTPKQDDDDVANEQPGASKRAPDTRISRVPGRPRPPDSERGRDQRALARRRLRVAGSLQNVNQSADEIAGVAEAFDDLGDQLTHNRNDNPDLKNRLREQIAEPLEQIASERMPQLVVQLKLVEEYVEDATIGEPELAKSIALADEILVEMRQVLDRMLELETYNEVVALLRGIITDQDEINQRTKERQKERLRSLFED
jgi:hypothetical protein